MKKLLLFSALALFVGLTSCSKSNQLDITAEQLDLLQTYVHECDDLIDVTGEIDGNVSAIFSASLTINYCTGATFLNGGIDSEATALLADMVDKMGFESAVELHDWMVAAGRVMYDIKRVNKKNFDTDREMLTELACMVVPEIFTRNNGETCYKDNLVALFIGTLEAGDNYGTRLAYHGTKEASESQCSARGSSFNKIWLFMKNNFDCR